MLPFHSSLLNPAAVSGCDVTPAFIRYELADGSVENEVCYWRDMTFVNHFLNLLTKREIRAHVRYGMTRPAITNRKLMAQELHKAVSGLSVIG